MPKVYAPEVVASAILRSATRPAREVYVGGGGPHRPLSFVGNQGGRTKKALHIRLKARRGKEREVANLLDGIRRDVAAGPGTRPWFAVRLSRRVFGIFERFPNEAGRKAHLAGRGAARLMARSNAVLAKPAAVSKLDVIGVKPS